MAAIPVTSFEAGLSATMRAELQDALKDGVSGGVTRAGPIPLAAIPASVLDLYEVAFLIALRAQQTNPGLRLPSYIKTALPSAAVPGVMIYVTNDVGGAVPAFSDGTNWRRVTDRAIIA